MGFLFLCPDNRRGLFDCHRFSFQKTPYQKMQQITTATFYHKTKKKQKTKENPFHFLLFRLLLPRTANRCYMSICIPPMRVDAYMHALFVTLSLCLMFNGPIIFRYGWHIRIAIANCTVCMAAYMMGARLHGVTKRCAIHHTTSDVPVCCRARIALFICWPLPRKHTATAHRSMGPYPYAVHWHRQSYAVSFASTQPGTAWDP